MQVSRLVESRLVVVGDAGPQMQLELQAASCDDEAPRLPRVRSSRPTQGSPNQHPLAAAPAKVFSATLTLALQRSLSIETTQVFTAMTRNSACYEGQSSLMLYLITIKTCSFAKDPGTPIENAFMSCIINLLFRIPAHEQIPKLPKQLKVLEEGAPYVYRIVTGK